jgi:hypothetical protein
MAKDLKYTWMTGQPVQILLMMLLTPTFAPLACLKRFGTRKPEEPFPSPKLVILKALLYFAVWVWA